MAVTHNSDRRSIEFLVHGPLPPHSTNVLWMDSSISDTPVLKIFWNGCWVPCHTDESREISILTKTIEALIANQQDFIHDYDELKTSYEHLIELFESIKDQQSTISTLTNNNTHLIQQFDDYDESVAERINQIIGADYATRDEIEEIINNVFNT